MELQVMQTKNPRTLITEAIRSLKAEGRKRINVIDLHFRTGLGFPTINKIMDCLEAEGIVHEAED